MRFLVLGSGSFTGATFVAHLLDRGCSVVGVNRSPEADPILVPYRYQRTVSPEQFQFHQIDVNHDLDRLARLLDEFQPDYVANFAAQGEVRNSWNWPEQWYQTNCLGVVRVAELLRKKPYLKRYFAASTPEVYGATGENVRENHVYQPSTPYGASKLAGDLHLFALGKRWGFPAVFTRAANLYGIHQQLYRIIPRAVIYLKLGRRIELHGRGLARRAFIHGRDVADATYRALVSGRNGEVYHLSPDEGLMTIADVVRMVAELMGRRFEDSVTMMDENFGQDALFSLDSTKARTELGWRPTVTFAEGVRETIEWIETNWDFIRRQPLNYIHKL